MKKVIYFLDFPSSIGGANKVLLVQARIMQQRGKQVLIVIPNNPDGKHVPEYDRLCREYNLRTVTARYPISTSIEEIDIMEAMNASGVIKRIIAKFEPDLIHSVQLNIAVELAARELKIPHLMNIYPTDIEAFHINWMRIYPQYHCADSILFSERWSKGLEISSRCIRVAYKYSGESKKDDCTSPKERINILSIGVLCEWKNQLEIIKFAMLCQENGYCVRLEILGNYNNAYGEMCRRFVYENNLQNIVVFRGFVTDVEAYFQKADLFILASTMESYPGVIVESMANTVPIVATSVAGVPELLKDRINGFLAKGQKADDIYSAFVEYMDCLASGMLDQVVDNAYDTYLRYHTYENIGDQLEDYYQWIIEDYHNKEVSCLKLDEVRQIFEQFIYDRGLEQVQQILMKKLWLLYHVIPILENKKNKKTVIWGAGHWGSIALDWLRLMREQAEFIGFIDTFKKGEYLGYPIVADKDAAVAMSGIIIVALENRKDRLTIIDYLESRGKIRNIDYFMVCNEPIRI